MKIHITIFFLIPTLLVHTSLFALSLVYSFRIAQITQRPIAEQADLKPDNVAPIIFDYFQKAKNFNIRENYTGGFITYDHNFEHNFVRTDFAIAHVSQSIDNQQTVDVIEPDDILCTAGHNLFCNEKTSVTLSGLLGIPTHSVNTLERAGFGNGQVGLGVQLDGIYRLTHVDFYWGGRYNYFIPRTAFDANHNAYQFTVGSIADLLVAIETSKPLGHGAEGGYSGRWGFGAEATPRIATLDQLSYMRNTFYIVYKYTFLKPRTAHRFLFSISYGFDSKPELYGYQAWMVLGSWGMAF